MAINEPVISPCRICFLGYNQLTEMACRVLDSFPFDDCEICGSKIFKKRIRVNE